MDKADIARKSSLSGRAKAQDAASDAFRLSDFHYDLPDELIAQAPLAARSDSRLMVVDGRVCEEAGAENPGSQAIQHLSVRDLPRLFKKGDHLVFNNTRVIPARLYGKKASGGKLELRLERVTSEGRVLARIRASKSPALTESPLLTGSSISGPETRNDMLTSCPAAARPGKVRSARSLGPLTCMALTACAGFGLVGSSAQPARRSNVTTSTLVKPRIIVVDCSDRFISVAFS